MPEYVKLPRQTARLLFKNLNALWHLFLNSISHRLATPKKAKPFALNYNSRIQGKSSKIFFYEILVSLPQEYKIFSLEFVYLFVLIQKETKKSRLHKTLETMYGSIAIF